VTSLLKIHTKGWDNIIINKVNEQQQKSGGASSFPACEYATLFTRTEISRIQSYPKKLNSPVDVDEDVVRQFSGVRKYEIGYALASNTKEGINLGSKAGNKSLIV